MFRTSASHERRDDERAWTRTAGNAPDVPDVLEGKAWES
jgi:hypothetical protein